MEQVGHSTQPCEKCLNSTEVKDNQRLAKCAKCGAEWPNRSYEPPEKRKYDLKFRAILDDMYRVARGYKTSDYGETWARLGLLGLYVKIFIKEGRLNQLIWKRKTPVVKDESVRDTLLDMANYCVYSVIALDEGNITGTGKRKEYMLEMLEELKNRVENMEDDE